MTKQIDELKSLLRVEKSAPTISIGTSQVWRLPDEQGTIHRDYGPAVTYANGKQEWRKNGLLHREDGPAVFHPDGIEEWYFNGKRHRIGGPAVLWYGKQEWWVEGKMHREDGPALEAWDNYKEYWIHGKKLSEQEARLVIKKENNNE